MERRQFIRNSVACGASVLLANSATEVLAANAAAKPPADAPRTPKDCIERLKKGNERFASSKATGKGRDQFTRVALSTAQFPFAAIVGCADSRVSPELIFDQGIGDLFVVRVAGNVVAGSGAAIKGSLEYAVENLHVKTILVLGHAHCGAVKAAVEAMNAPAQPASASHIHELIKLIEPAVQAAKAKPAKDLVQAAIVENVKIGIENIKHYDDEVSKAISSGAVCVVGAVYDLETGKVEFLPS